MRLPTHPVPRCPISLSIPHHVARLANSVEGECGPSDHYAHYGDEGVDFGGHEFAHPCAGECSGGLKGGVSFVDGGNEVEWDGLGWMEWLVW